MMYHLVFGVWLAFIWPLGSYLLRWTIHYQNEKPQEEKALEDILIKDNLRAVMIFHHTLCFSYFLALLGAPFQVSFFSKDTLDLT